MYDIVCIIIYAMLCTCMGAHGMEVKRICYSASLLKLQDDVFTQKSRSRGVVM